LSRHGLSIGKHVQVIYSNHTEIAQLLATGTIQYAVDAQPFITANLQRLENYHVIADFVSEWKLVRCNLSSA
jgi:hypothetical protein